MATLKHIASKNSDYTAIEAYLVYQHDAFTGKQLLDEHGKPKLRDSYLGNSLLYISLSSVAFGRVRPIQGRTLFFVLPLIF